MLEGYESRSFSAEGITRTVHYRGEGPGVVIIHEIPGITPEVERFARLVVERGYRVAMPELFGTAGKAFSYPYMLREIAAATCVRREFSVFARRESSPVTNYLRALCRDLHGECGGPGVGAIGMCLTGNFALSLMVDPSVMAPVLAQPSLPFGITPSHRRALHVSDDELACIKRRVQVGETQVLGLRYHGDPLCPPERFERLREELGEGFESIELEQRDRNPKSSAPVAHSVLTMELVDEEGHPTRRALDRVLSFFDQQLKA
jgi:dienelactone hydrolase